MPAITNRYANGRIFFAKSRPTRRAKHHKARCMVWMQRAL